MRTHNCTITNITPIARLLLGAEPTADDARNPLRSVIVAPRTLAEQFAKRFDVKVCSAFGTTEVGVPILAGFDAPDASCGKPRTGYPGVEVRVVDENDHGVPDGDVGELLIRTSEPWALLTGYFDEWEATAKAWRNGWYHTGDAFRRDAEGYLYFVDRTKDALRRRGENISSFEVEAMVNSSSVVAESAAVGVPTDGEEDELLIVVVPADPSEPLDVDALYAYLVTTMPRSMTPRYIRVVDELPKTAATARIQKVKLRQEGVVDGTWDRQQ